MLPAIFALIAILQAAHGRVIHSDLDLDLDHDMGWSLNMDLTKDKKPNEHDVSEDIDQRIQAASHGHSGQQENGLFREGLDIMLTKEQVEILHSGENSRQERKATADLTRRWTNNQVWYRKTPGDFQLGEWLTVQFAMAEFEDKTCLTFHEDVEQNQTNYVHFNNSGGCRANLGMVGGEQTLWLGGGCNSDRIIIHEIGHAIGFWHEQSRPDRDAYIDIKWDNIENIKINKHNFEIRDIENYNVPYDLYSIMHYGRYSVAKNRSKPTIDVIDSNYKWVIGHANRLSFYDVMLANRMYSCDAKCETKSSCPEHAYRGKDCKCYCLGISRYNGKGRECSPVTETPSTDRPTTEIPTTEIPTTEIPTTEIPTTETPTTDSDSGPTDRPTTDWPTTDWPTTDWPTTDWRTTDWPTTDWPTTDWPTTDWPTTKPDC